MSGPNYSETWDQRMGKEQLTEDPRVEARRQLVKARYAELRNLSPTMYERCSTTASAIRHNHDLTLQATAEVEEMLVALVLDSWFYARCGDPPQEPDDG